MIQAKVICDSISTTSSVRLTTIEIKAHRYILPEINTHRAFSRNASSSRAIPVSKTLDRVRNDPAEPIHWSANKKGMAADEELTLSDKQDAQRLWDDARIAVISHVEALHKLNLHKAVANRLLEPFSHISVIVTATEWDNFYHLRIHPAAQPEMRALAEAMLEVHNNSRPRKKKPGEWHLPYVSDEELAQIGLENARKASVARTARVSYTLHDGTATNLEKDIALHDQLLKDMHASPFEHQSTPMAHDGWAGNLRGWEQYRKTLPNENQKNYPGLKVWTLAEALD